MHVLHIFPLFFVVFQTLARRYINSVIRSLVLIYIAELQIAALPLNSYGLYFRHVSRATDLTNLQLNTVCTLLIN